MTVSDHDLWVSLQRNALDRLAEQQAESSLYLARHPSFIDNVAWSIAAGGHTATRLTWHLPDDAQRLRSPLSVAQAKAGGRPAPTITSTSRTLPANWLNERLDRARNLVVPISVDAGLVLDGTRNVLVIQGADEGRSFAWHDSDPRLQAVAAWFDETWQQLEAP